MTGRSHSYYFGDDERPMVSWQTIPEHDSFEDEIIERLDSQRAMSLFVSRLSPVERKVYHLLVTGFPIPREHRNAVASLRKKLAVTRGASFTPKGESVSSRPTPS